MKIFDIPLMLFVLFRMMWFKIKSPPNQLTIGKKIGQNAKRFPNKVMMIDSNRSITWKQFNELSNRFADLLKSKGFEKGETIAIMMANRIEFLALLTGASKVGVISGLINITLKGKVLLDAFEAINAKYLFYGEEVTNNVNELRKNLEKSIDQFIYIKDGETEYCKNGDIDFYSEIQNYTTNEPSHIPEIDIHTPCYYIFTSGTTGKIKPILISHLKWYRASKAFADFALLLTKKDIMYNFLPIYHGSGLHTAFGPVVLKSATLVLKRKFSASDFFFDVNENNVTCFSYIGEICRFLLNHANKEKISVSKSLKCTGNGLQYNIWDEFKNKLNIKRICEFYALTEGNMAFLNSFNKKETFGFSLSSFNVVQYDSNTEELARDNKNRLLNVKAYQQGMLITKITNTDQYQFYSNNQHLKNKILYNVFQKGDAYFLTGDIIKRVNVGFSFGLPHYQFIDRANDTYRWRGENISSSDTASVIAKHSFIKDVIVFGVKIPNIEGKAGMAVIEAVKKDFDLGRFSEYLYKSMSKEAIPLFLRLVNRIEKTSTHKNKKSAYQNEGYNINKVSDSLFVLNLLTKSYKALDNSMYEKIISGKYNEF
ncbi:MAG: AMP-binding protein [Bacteroidales bacterium]|nr:AMP-binding protein [Bacteroidales bacterium]